VGKGRVRVLSSNRLNEKRGAKIIAGGGKEEGYLGKKRGCRKGEGAHPWVDIWGTVPYITQKHAGK